MRGNATRPRDGSPARRAAAPRLGRTEDVHLRNYDFRQGYDLDVRVSDGDGVVFSERYYFQPGERRSEIDAVVPGEYEVAVRLDNRGWETTTCEIGPDPERTLLVELGNGVVSVTQGVY